MLLQYLYASGFDARETRRPTKEQYEQIGAAQRLLESATSNDRAAIVFALTDMKLIERRDGRWTITAAGRSALADEERGK